MSPSKRIMPPLIALLVLLAIVLAWHLSVFSPTKDLSGQLTNPEVLTSNAPPQPLASSDDPKRNSAAPVLSTAEELSVQELQKLLDDDSKHRESLAKALAMANGSIREQVAAIDAFRWLGGRKAMKALIQLRNQAYAPVADEAGNVLNHLLSEGLYQDGIRRDTTPDDGIVALDEGLYDDELNDEDQRPDAALWLEAIQQAPDDNARDALLIILSAYPADQSVPILLQLLDSPDAAMRDSAKEHLQSITGGVEILTREQGEEWLAKAIANPTDQTAPTLPAEAE